MAHQRVKNSAGTVFQVLAEHREYYFLVETGGPSVPPITDLKSNYTNFVPKPRAEDRYADKGNGDLLTVRAVYEDPDATWIRLQDPRGAMRFVLATDLDTKYTLVGSDR